MVNPERPAAIAARQVDEDQYWETFLGADLGLVDPDIDAIIGFEEERQARKLIMIPSESMAPRAVRQALGSVFNNVYAEGYPPLRMTRDDEETILDYPPPARLLPPLRRPPLLQGRGLRPLRRDAGAAPRRA